MLKCYIFQTFELKIIYVTSMIAQDTKPESLTPEPT